MYLEGIIHQIGAFAMLAGVTPGDVVVRLAMTGGDYVLFRGVRVIAPFGGSEWGMALAGRSPPTEAVLIREADVYKVELRVAAVDERIGFATEGRPPRQP